MRISEVIRLVSAQERISIILKETKVLFLFSCSFLHVLLVNALRTARIAWFGLLSPLRVLRKAGFRPRKKKPIPRPIAIQAKMKQKLLNGY